MTPTLRRYLVVFAVLLALAVSALYLRHRAREAAAAAAACDSPAPPPTTPPPKLPGFAVEPACGTGADSPKPAEKKK